MTETWVIGRVIGRVWMVASSPVKKAQLGSVWGLGFRVWGLGFGVWGLGFGGWGVGFGVCEGRWWWGWAASTPSSKPYTHNI